MNYSEAKSSCLMEGLYLPLNLEHHEHISMLLKTDCYNTWFGSVMPTYTMRKSKPDSCGFLKPSINCQKSNITTRLTDYCNCSKKLPATLCEVELTNKLDCSSRQNHQNLLILVTLFLVCLVYFIVAPALISMI